MEARLGGFLSQVRELTQNPGQPSTLESMSWTARKLGYTVANVLTITDAEVALVQDVDVDVFLDLCELKTLKSMGGNLPAVDTTVGPESVKLSKLSDTLETLIKRRSGEVEAEWGYRIPGIGSTRRKARIILP